MNWRFNPEHRRKVSKMNLDHNSPQPITVSHVVPEGRHAANLKTLFSLGVMLPTIFEERFGIAVWGDAGKQLGLVVGCIASFMIGWLIVKRSPNRDQVHNQLFNFGMVGVIAAITAFPEKPASLWIWFFTTLGTLLGMGVLAGFTFWVFVCLTIKLREDS